MKTLIRKELRESSKIGVVGFAVFTLLVLATCRNYSQMIEEFASGSGSGDYWESLQPLISSLFIGETAWFCAVFGALLGWVQAFHERHRDLWAYLVHRPVSRTTIFFAKTIAGLCIYFLAAGVPLACFILWTALPGHVAAPFEWNMAEPVVSHFLAGVAFYFAGLLTGLRQARWYGSRALGLGLPILLSVVVFASSAFWLELLSILLGAVCLALAAWGAFHSHGHYEGQPAPGKWTLNLSLTAGGVVVLFLSPLPRRSGAKPSGPRLPMTRRVTAS